VAHSQGLLTPCHHNSPLSIYSCRCWVSLHHISVVLLSLLNSRHISDPLSAHWGMSVQQTVPSISHVIFILLRHPGPGSVECTPCQVEPSFWSPGVPSAAPKTAALRIASLSRSGVGRACDLCVMRHASVHDLTRRHDSKFSTDPPKIVIIFLARPKIVPFPISAYVTPSDSSLSHFSIAKSP
jgi:hypothetical protein